MYASPHAENLMTPRSSPKDLRGGRLSVCLESLEKEDPLQPPAQVCLSVCVCVCVVVVVVVVVVCDVKDDLLL